ncbi:IAA-alanine resistance protein 1-like protein [Drosera capensis]
MEELNQRFEMITEQAKQLLRDSNDEVSLTDISANKLVQRVTTDQSLIGNVIMACPSLESSSSSSSPSVSSHLNPFANPAHLLDFQFLKGSTPLCFIPIWVHLTIPTKPLNKPIKKRGDLIILRRRGDSNLLEFSRLFYPNRGFLFWDWKMLPFWTKIVPFVLVVLLVLLNLCLGHQSPAAHQGCSHGHGHNHHQHHPQEGHEHENHHQESRKKLPEELAEEEDLRLYGFGSHHEHDHEHDGHGDYGVGGASMLTGSGLIDFGALGSREMVNNCSISTSTMPATLLLWSPWTWRLLGQCLFVVVVSAGLWIHALGCSLLVSMASLVCLITIPVIFVHGKPSQGVVDSLAAFGAGAMLGDAFLHQLPHAFGGGHSHSHYHEDRVHSALEQSHGHSLKDLSVGLSILSGIVLFLIVEKVVRYVEEMSGRSHSSSYGHHHHHHKNAKKLKGDDDLLEKLPNQTAEGEKEIHANGEEEKQAKSGSTLQKRNKNIEPRTAKSEDAAAANGTFGDQDQSSGLSPSNLVFGYLNLISDGVHNFTDGMALGSAFLLYGSVGGWSRTLFLLAHELPQEIGDFGILLRSGFSVSKALFFNFLSALVALAGTALALVLGHNPGYSSLIEGFTAGGFIYIAVAGVLAEMNNNGKTSVRTSMVHLTTLVMGMGVALGISLVE